jgi:hypothetical protein
MVVDTLKACRKYFGCEANSLDSVCQELGLGRKKHSGGFETSAKCMIGDDKAWQKLISYGKHDVILLRELYKRILPFIKDHPNMALLKGGVDSVCPVCTSKNIQWRGEAHTKTMSYHRFQCNECRSWGRARKTFLKKPQRDAVLKSG